MLLQYFLKSYVVKFKLEQPKKLNCIALKKLLSNYNKFKPSYEIGFNSEEIINQTTNPKQKKTVIVYFDLNCFTIYENERQLKPEDFNCDEF